MRPHDVTTILNYFEDNDYDFSSASTYVGKTETFARSPKPHKTVIHDIRGNESQYTLDTKGFQIIKHVSEEKDFLDDEQIKRIYYPETEKLLKKV